MRADQIEHCQSQKRARHDRRNNQQARGEDGKAQQYGGEVARCAHRHLIGSGLGTQVPLVPSSQALRGGVTSTALGAGAVGRRGWGAAETVPEAWGSPG